MYQSTFGITAPPFQLTADPSFYFESNSHRQALAKLRRCLVGQQGLIVVTGDVGVGKTTLVRTLLRRVDPNALKVGTLVSTQLDADDVLSAAAIAFGVAAQETDIDGSPVRFDDAENLIRFLLALEKEGGRAALIVDEAQNLPRAALDRLLVFTQTMPEDLGWQVWLVGQTELRSMLEAEGCAAFSPMLRGMCHLGPMDRGEIGAYIEHRLGKVGWKGTPCFEPGAFEAIFRWTEGVPRRINQLCNRLLLARSLDSQMAIDERSVELLASELRAEIDLNLEPRSDPRASAALLPVTTPGLQTLQSQSRPRAPVPVVSSPPLLCVASAYGDHIKAAAFIRALSPTADAGPRGSASPRLLRVHDSDSLAYCGRLYANLDAARHTIDLGVPEGPHEEIVLDLMTAFAAALDRMRPGGVVVFDGSQAAFACSTVARAKQIPVIHVGAGLRVDESFVTAAATRKLTDHLADVLFTGDAYASQTLGAEGVSPERVHCVGNLAVDAMNFAMSLRAPMKPSIRNDHGYALAVVSNSVNIGGREPLAQLTEMVSDVSRVIPVVWLMRSKLHGQLKKYHLVVYLPNDRVRRMPAQPYVDYLALLRGAACVLTDSWNVQEEASALRIPCLTIGVFPERRIPGGSNLSVGLSRTRAVSAVWESVLNGTGARRAPPLWDGRSGARMAGYLSAWNGGTAAVGH